MMDVHSLQGLGKGQEKRRDAEFGTSAASGRDSRSSHTRNDTREREWQNTEYIESTPQATVTDEYSMNSNLSPLYHLAHTVAMAAAAAHGVYLVVLHPAMHPPVLHFITIAMLAFMTSDYLMQVIFMGCLVL